MARHLIFDFFGTLVTYRDGVRGNPVKRAHAELLRHGMEINADAFADSFAACFTELELAASTTLEEFSIRHCTNSSTRTSKIGPKVSKLCRRCSRG